MRTASLIVPPAIAIMMFAVWAQAWVVLTLDDGARILVAGDRAAVALPAVAIASLALTAALAIANARVRPVLGALLSALGLLAIVVSFRTVGDPAGAALSAVTALTGVEGESSVRALVASTALTPWPFIAVVLGILATASGLLVAITARAWPARTQRFERGAQRSGFPREARPVEGDESIGAWDALSDGQDPTAR